MRFTDLIRSAAGGLWRQKVRTALTLTGVAVGASSLAFSLSLGVGLRGMIDREFQSRPGFWQIQVHPARTGRPPDTPPPPDKVAVQGDLTADRAGRIREHLAERYWQTERPLEPVPLTPEALARIAAMPDVTDVHAARYLHGWAQFGDRSTDAQIVAGPCDLPPLRDRLIDGRLPADSAAPEAAVSETTLYDLGVRDEAAFAAVLGKSITIELGADTRAGLQRMLAANLAGGRVDELTPRQLVAVGKLLADPARLVDRSDLTPAEKADLKGLFAGKSKSPAGGETKKREPAAGTFTIVGVLRKPTRTDFEGPQQWQYQVGNVFVSGPAGEPVFRRIPWVADGHYDQARVTVRPGSDLPEAVKQIEGMGYTTYSAVQWFSAAKREVTAIAAGLNVFALISLLVAALGITNTLVTSVVERTREIGILKALGARDGHVMALFLLEGSLIGLSGGLLGLGLARAAAVPADALVKRLVEEQARGERLLTETVFEFPLWLSLTTVLFSVGVTTLAAFYPARRAARVQPVEALRHE